MFEYVPLLSHDTALSGLTKINGNFETVFDYMNAGLTGSDVTFTSISPDTVVVSGNPLYVPKMYKATLTQTGTAAPVPSVIVNTLGADITFDYIAPGKYAIYASSAVFNSGNADMVASLTPGGESFFVAGIKANSQTRLDLNLWDVISMQKNDVLDFGFLSIEVYN